MADEHDFRQKWGFGIIDRYYNNKTQLQTGIDLQRLGFDYGPEGDSQLHKRLISILLEDNHSQADPFMKPQEFISKNKCNVIKKKDFFANFSDETLFYIFYNMIEEQQQLWAVEALYSKGWLYNYKKEQWFKDLQSTGQNLFQCSYMSVQNWKVMNASQVQLFPEEFVSVEEFYAMQQS